MNGGTLPSEHSPPPGGHQHVEEGNLKGNSMESMDPVQTTRRNFIAGAAAAGVAALFPNLVSAVQNASGNNPRRIDVHHHFTPDVYLAYQRAHPEAGGGGGGEGGGARGGGRGGRGG